MQQCITTYYGLLNTGNQCFATSAVQLLFRFDRIANWHLHVLMPNPVLSPLQNLFNAKKPKEDQNPRNFSPRKPSSTLSEWLSDGNQ